jgi:hypothetical protein
MSGFVLRALLYLVLGGLLGLAHARSVTDGERLFRQTGERARPTALFLVRFILVFIAFGMIGKAGPLPLVTALAGFFGTKLILAAMAQRTRRSRK